MSVLEVSRPKIPMFQKIRIFSLFPFFSALCLNMLDAWSKYILSHISFKHIILQVRKINFIFYLWCFIMISGLQKVVEILRINRLLTFGGSDGK